MSLFLALGSACGPIQSTAMMRDASQALDRARLAQAEVYAPYEWHKASLYLKQAKIEVGHSRYQVAFEYAKKSLALAQKADDVAKTLNPPVVDEDEQ
jgi:Domain of unknown function (DUF4398)